MYGRNALTRIQIPHIHALVRTASRQQAAILYPILVWPILAIIPTVSHPCKDMPIFGYNGC